MADRPAMTSRELNRATLARQLLLRRADVSPSAAVQRVVAVQAQEPASPYLALWARVQDLDPADVDAAFASGELVKATLMRITLHAVHASDHPTMHAAMQPTLRAARLNDRRYRDAGLTPADADAQVTELLGFLASPRSNADVEAWFADRGLDEPRLWWALRHYAPVRHAPTGPPWTFGRRPAHVAGGIPTPEPGDSEGADAALADLVVRYLEGFGPATVPDMAQFMLVQRGRLRPVLAELLGDRVEELAGPERPLFDVVDGPRPAGDVVAPARLLPMWDSILFAYDDRSRVLPDDLRPHVIRRNGDCLPTVLVDGHVAGVWRPVDGGIEVTALTDITAAGWEQLAAEAGAVRAFLDGREPDAYSRYVRWWDRLPAGEVRVLPGD